MSKRAAAAACLVLVACACGAAPEAAPPDPSPATPEPVALDIGPEVVDGVLHPPGLEVGAPTAVSRSRTGWVVTYDSGTSEGGRVQVLADDGQVLAEGEGVLGPGVADPSSDLAAWTESRRDGNLQRLVIVDTATGERLERHPIQDPVVAVHDDEVVVQGGNVRSFRVGAEPEVLSEEDDALLWGYDGEHLVYGDFESEVWVTDRAGGSRQDFEGSIAYLSAGTGRLALLDEDGLSVADLATGEVTELPVEDPSLYVIWTLAGDLVVHDGGLFPEDGVGDRYVCVGGTADCRPAPPADGGEVTPVLAGGSLVGILTMGS